MSYARLSPADALELMRDPELVIADIRDEASYRAGCLEGAVHLSDHNIAGFLETASKDAPLLLYCFHGISSRSAAEYFVEQGFVRVYSLEGGYTGWPYDA